MNDLQRPMRYGAILWCAANAWQRTMTEVLEPLSLTPVQFMLLTSLAGLAGDNRPITQTKLARSSGADKMMTSQVLRRLEARGLIERGPHPTDSRAKVLALTLNGAEVTRKAAVLAETAEQEFFGSMGDERVAAMAALEKLLPPG